MASTSTSLTLPVLPLDDEVVLPGMVVPLDLNDADVRAAVEAAQAAARSEPGKPRVLLVPRVDGSYPGTGVLGTVEQVGRLADGDPGALIRGRGRVQIGTNAFYFQEGHADRYAAARYGEFKVARDGTAILIGLRDAERRPLGAEPAP